MEYNFKLCVICTGDSGAAENLAYSLVTRGGVRLVICTENADVKKIPAAAENSRIDFAPCSIEDINSLLASPDAPLVMFADAGTTFAPGFVELLEDKAVVFNAATEEKNAPRKLYRDGFSAHEAFSPAVGVNFVMRSEVINEHEIKLLSANSAGFAAFAAQYAAYENFEPIHEVLLYGAKPIEWNAESFEIIAKSVSTKGGLSALTLLLSAYCGLDKAGKEAEFDTFSAAAKPFFENEAYNAYALAAFGIDSAMLKEGCRAGEFVSAGMNAMYKEVTLPILADDVVRDFYGGKLSFGTLRRCIAAWLYFKLYRMGGAAKKLGCKVCSKLAGGDLNV
ncbi:MAG TPA: hypothetical protein DEQ52_02215 [Ruminococcaceae bacterium]|nr:hypothetical protein [Oscillospiraceae bacterium]